MFDGYTLRCACLVEKSLCNVSGSFSLRCWLSVYEDLNCGSVSVRDFDLSVDAFANNKAAASGTYPLRFGYGYPIGGFVADLEEA